jgi:hypothetical protein
VQATQLIINETLITELLRENVDLLLFDKTSTCCFILAGMLNVTRVDVSSIGFAAGAAFAYYFSLDTNISESPIYLTQETVTNPTDPAKFSFKRRLTSFVYYGMMRMLFVGCALQRPTICGQNIRK